VLNGRLDPWTLVGDGARELDERRKATSPGPGEPRVEQLDRLLVADAVDQAQLLGDQVAAVQRFVGLLDVRELGLLFLVEFGGIHPQREAAALDRLRLLRVPFAARLVPHLAADLIERVGRELDHVERVHAADSVRAPVSDRGGDRLGHVAGDQLELLAPVCAEQIQELLDGSSITAGRRPDEPAGVVIDDHCQVAMSLSICEVVDPDSLQPPELVAVGERLRSDPPADVPDRAPGDSHQLGHGLARRVDRQPADLVLERDREPRVVPSPRDRGDNDAMLLAVHPWCVRLEVRERRPEIQRPPPTASLAGVLPRAAAAARPAATLLPRLRSHRHHDRAELDADVLDHRPLDPEQHLPYASGAHAATAFLLVPDLRSRNRRSAARRALPSCPEVGRSQRPDLTSPKRGRRRLPSSANHATSSQNVPRTAPTIKALLDQTTTAALPRTDRHLTPGNSTSA
jgi:hypothetical protein